MLPRNRAGFGCLGLLVTLVLAACVGPPATALPVMPTTAAAPTVASLDPSPSNTAPAPTSTFTNTSPPATLTSTSTTAPPTRTPLPTSTPSPTSPPAPTLTEPPLPTQTQALTLTENERVAQGTHTHDVTGSGGCVPTILPVTVTIVYLTSDHFQQDQSALALGGFDFYRLGPDVWQTTVDVLGTTIKTTVTFVGFGLLVHREYSSSAGTFACDATYRRID